MTTSRTHSRNHSILVTTDMQKEIRSRGAALLVRDGGWPGIRIHFSDPKDQGYAGEASFPAIDGEAYCAPQGEFDRFWVTCQNAPTTARKLEITVVGTVTPVVDLSRIGGRGQKVHIVGAGTISSQTVAQGIVTLYQDNVSGNAGEVADQATSSVFHRGFIGGGIRGISTDSYRVTFWQHLDATRTALAEICRFEVATVDVVGTAKSCSFEQGARTAYHSAGSGLRNGPMLVPWPAFGLTVTLEAITSTVTDVTWLLYERSDG